jgi:hypothetical protein
MKKDRRKGIVGEKGKKDGKQGKLKGKKKEEEKREERGERKGVERTRTVMIGEKD